MEKYQPKDTKRAGKLSIKGFSHQILVELASEGIADSVEFRRLARKFIREIKNANCDILLWNDVILGEKKTAKILQKICGSQLKCVFMTEICTNKVFVKNFEEKFPGKNFLALEIREKLIQMLEKKFSEQENIQVLNGDAGKNWTNIIKPCQEQGAIIENVFINFPDPWFKVKHHKRRFVSEGFLQSASEIFDEKTTFYFQTDQKELFDDTLEIVQNSVFNKITFFENSQWGITTDWEEAKMRENAPIFRMKFSK